MRNLKLGRNLKVTSRLLAGRASIAGPRAYRMAHIVCDLRSRLVEDDATYPRSVIEIAAPRIMAAVDEALGRGTDLETQPSDMAAVGAEV